MKTLPVHIAYGGLALFISLLNNVFLLFYVSTFISVYGIDGKSFYIGETIFLLWNSVNDPLFGWISDRSILESDGTTRKDSTSIVLKRIDILNKFGPLYALCFLLFWFPILPVGIQFSVALCFYDSFLTMVDLHHQALLADLAVEAKDRVKLNTYCSVFSAAGSVSVFLSFALWDKKDLFQFQIFCVILAAIVCIGFNICCTSMKTFYLTIGVKKSDNFISPRPTETLNSMKKYASQVYRHKNFLIFSLMNLLQVFHCHFNSNFFPLFIHHFLGHKMSQKAAALLLGLSFLVPHINNLYFLQLCKNYGVYSIIKSLFFVKVSLAFLMWNFGVSHWYLLCIFIMSNRIFTEGTCKLLNLVISDLVDEDYVRFKRSSPVSALVFGTAAFLSKPGQTLAPLLGSYFLYVQTGQSMFLKQSNGEADVSTGLTHDDSPHETGNHSFEQGCFVVMVSVSIICGVTQLIIWNFFSLKDKYLQQIKTDRVYMEKGYHSNII